jgi:2-keto-3-deoxy-L-fuconate dehydrogenase
VSTPSAGPFRLDGKVALVTGGASGIGAEIVRVLAGQGATVVIGDLNEAAGTTLAAELGATFTRLDVSDEAAVATAFAAVDAVGPIALLVNCAGVGFVGDLLNTPLADYERLFSINARGVFLCAKETVRRMKESGRGGSIVNIASIASKVSLAERFAYSATKGAVLMMTRSIAGDYIHDKIRCNCVCPARVHTPFVDAYLAKNYPGQETEKFAELSAAQPIGRMGTPREIAHLVLYLCSDEAAFVTGVAYDIDGGTLALR